MTDENVIDCRNMACPAPVLTTKEAVEKNGAEKITVLVDNSAAMENVSRFLNYREFEVSVTEANEVFSVYGARKQGQAPSDKQAEPGSREKTEPAGAGETTSRIMVMVASDKFGKGDDALGQKLMINFLKTVREMGDDLWRLVFVNSGVRLTVKGSEVVGEIREIEDQGVSVLVCGTCLTHFDLMAEKAVGQTTNMLDIVTSMQLADKVINL